MKKIILFIMIFSILFSFAACKKAAVETQMSTEPMQTEETLQTEGATIPENTQATEETAEPTETQLQQTVASKPKETQPKPTVQQPTQTKPVQTTSVQTKPTTGQFIETTGITLRIAPQRLSVGSKHALSATVSPANATDQRITWSSSNTAVAIIEQDMVIAVGVGTATITATASGGQTVSFDTEVVDLNDKSCLYESYEIVSTNMPNKYICADGQELLTKLHGTNKAFQIGDSVTLGIKMSSGTATEDLISIREALGCTYKISGNTITVTFDGTYTYARLDFKVKNSDNTYATDNFYVKVVQTDNLATSTGYLEQELKTYAASKGIVHITNGFDFLEKYNGGYTWNDESLSITGCAIKGTDDLIAVSGNSDWIDDALWLIDQYAKMGFTKWCLNLQATELSTLAE